MNLVPAHEYYPESRHRPKIFCLASRTHRSGGARLHGDGDEMNLYAYVGGNPANRTDPSGLLARSNFSSGSAGGSSSTSSSGGAFSAGGDGGVIVADASNQMVGFPLVPPSIDDGGCISTGGGPSICIGPGAIRSVATTLAEELDG